MYDKDNVFAKIIRGEIPSKKVVENEYAMSFYDVNPMCEKHVLVVPKGEYENILDFARRASAAEQAGFWDCFVKTADKLGINGEFNTKQKLNKAGITVYQISKSSLIKDLGDLLELKRKNDPRANIVINAYRAQVQIHGGKVV